MPLRRDTSYWVTDRADLEGWAKAYWMTVHPWAERVRVVRVVSAPPTEDW